MMLFCGSILYDIIWLLGQGANWTGRLNPSDIYWPKMGGWHTASWVFIPVKMIVKGLLVFTVFKAGTKGAATGRGALMKHRRSSRCWAINSLKYIKI